MPVRSKPLAGDISKTELHVVVARCEGGGANDAMHAKVPIVANKAEGG